MVAGAQQAAQGQVERLGYIVAEDYVQRVGGVEELDHRLAGGVDDTTRLHRQAVARAAGVGADLLQEVNHRLGHSRRLGP
jgi:hypothetical protein